MIADGIFVRPAVPTDLESLRSIADECGLEEWSAGAYRKALSAEDSHILVAALEDRLAGFLTVRLITNDVSIDHSGPVGFSIGEIHNIGVLKRFQRRGIATRLLQGFFDVLPKDQGWDIFLEVREANQAAIEFYSSIGFVRAGVRKGLYSNPTDNGVVMSYRRDKVLAEASEIGLSSDLQEEFVGPTE